MNKIRFEDIPNAQIAEELVKQCMLLELKKQELHYEWLGYIHEIQVEVIEGSVTDAIKVTFHFIDETEDLILGPLPMSNVVKRSPHVEDFAQDIIHTLIETANEVSEG